MFTGIITDVGRVRDVAEADGGRRLEIATAYDLSAVAIGAYALGSGSGGDETVTAQGQAPAGATATVERTGDEGILRVTGLPQRRNGIYEVWIARDGQVQASTLFQVHRDGSGAAAIPEGLDGADQVMVTLEPPGGSPRPTRTPIIVTNI